MSELGRRRLQKAIGLMMLVILSTSCGISTGVKTCGPEMRGAGASGLIVLADGTSTANAGVGISQVREPGRPETEVGGMGIHAQSDFLRTHMLSAELRDAGTPSRLFGSYTPPALLPLPPNLFAFDGPYAWPVPFEDGLGLVLSGQLVLEIMTDIPSQPLVRIPLSTVAENNTAWFRTRGESCG